MQPFALRLTRLVVKLLAGLWISVTRYRRARGEARHAIVRRWSAEILGIAGIKVRAVGFPVRTAAQPAVTLVANHVSWCDIFALNAQQACHFVAKAELRDWPLAGKLLDNVGTVFIDRSDRKETHRLGEVVRNLMAAGETVAVFPEGTTSAGRDVLKFHASLFEPAVQAGGQVWVVAIRYFHGDQRTEAASYIGDMTFLQSLRSIHATQPITVEITFLGAIECAGRVRRDVAAQAEAMVREHVQRA